MIDGKEVIVVVVRSAGSTTKNMRLLELARRHAKELGLDRIELQISPAEADVIKRAQEKRARKAARGR